MLDLKISPLEYLKYSHIRMLLTECWFVFNLVILGFSWVSRFIILAVFMLSFFKFSLTSSWYESGVASYFLFLALDRLVNLFRLLKTFEVLRFEIWVLYLFCKMFFSFLLSRVYFELSLILFSFLENSSHSLFWFSSRNLLLAFHMFCCFLLYLCKC